MATAMSVTGSQAGLLWRRPRCVQDVGTSLGMLSAANTSKIK